VQQRIALGYLVGSKYVDLLMYWRDGVRPLVAVKFNESNFFPRVMTRVLFCCGESELHITVTNDSDGSETLGPEECQGLERLCVDCWDQARQWCDCARRLWRELTDPMLSA